MEEVFERLLVTEGGGQLQEKGSGLPLGIFFREGDAFQRGAFSKRGEDILTRRGGGFFRGMVLLREQNRES